MKQFYDVIVVGGGHAGCEAARAAARLGARTCLVTMDMNKIAQMSCNPAVGGIAKGQIVREIDALGGGMGIVTDLTAIQFRMLNKSKGPAMWSPRAQCDRGKFIWQWRELLDSTPNLDIWQDQVETITRGDQWICTTIWGCELIAPSVIITAGTFLNGLMHIGRRMVAGGRCAEPAALHLTESINALGIKSQRMKTGTPVRIDKRSVHFEDTELQPGEPVAQLFSYLPLTTIRESLAAQTAALSNEGSAVSAQASQSSVLTSQGSAQAAQSSVQYSSPALPQLPCYTFTTNAECHAELLKGLADSPLYNGQIQSIGPRYCPSVETKLVTFPDRDHHPLFLEPEGTDTNEMYLNGFSSSMPMEVQLNALRKIPALRDVKVYRPGYAIEYDFFDPTQLDHSLMSKNHEGLFFAGQVNGTTGYEEAAGQGLVAGINAALFAGSHGSGNAFQPFTLHRDEAYIGVLIDDLVMKGVDEPYRMFTSRAEYRILLRQDDADARLTERSHAIGLASTLRLEQWLQKKQQIEDIVAFSRNRNISPKEVNTLLENLGSTPLHGGCKLSELIARPGLGIADIASVLPDLQPLTQNTEAAECAEIQIKYDGYIRRERETADKMHRLENIRIPASYDYNAIQSLSTEARQKLSARRPATLAQASRIPGVSPSDVNVLLVLMGR